MRTRGRRGAGRWSVRTGSAPFLVRVAGPRRRLQSAPPDDRLVRSSAPGHDRHHPSDGRHGASRHRASRPSVGTRVSAPAGGRSTLPARRPPRVTGRRRDHARGAVEGTRPDVQLCVDPGGPEGARVRDGLVAEHLRAPAVQVRRRQPGQVRRTCRRGRRIDGVGPAALAEVRVPRDVHHLSVGDADPVELAAGHGGVAVVEHGGDEDLRRHRGTPAVASEQGDARGQPAAGALPGDDDPRRVDAELDGVLREPDETGVGVLDRVGVRVLGGQPVVDAHQDDVVVAEEPVVERVQVPEVVAEHHAAAVDRVDGGDGAGRVGAPDDGEVDRVAEVARHGDAPLVVADFVQVGVEHGFGDLEGTHAGSASGVRAIGPLACRAVRNTASSGSNGGRTVDSDIGGLLVGVVGRVVGWWTAGSAAGRPVVGPAAAGRRPARWPARRRVRAVGRGASRPPRVRRRPR